MTDAPAAPAVHRSSRRPQRLHTWMTLAPEAELRRDRPQRLELADSFVIVEASDDAEVPWRVRFEGDQDMTVVARHALVFVWLGSDLANPDRPFPVLFAEPFPTAYRSSPPTVFHDTHVMDFVENGSDNLHFTAVHLWEHSRIYDHEVGDDTITLLQETRFQYGKCSTKRRIRLLSKVLPQLELTQDYVYHGPCLAVVGATGKGTPDMHALVSLTPEGPNRTRVYVTIALSPDTFPARVERAFGVISRGRRLCDVVAGTMAGYIQNEFDVDAIVWAHRRYSPTPRLLPSEQHLAEVMRWGERFYPPGVDVVAPVVPEALPGWHVLGHLAELDDVEVRPFRVAGRDVAAHLDVDGTPVVVEAHCPHQGAHLGHGGRMVDGCLRCPFHGLHFDDEGHCIGRDPARQRARLDGLDLTRVAHRVVSNRVEVSFG